MIVPLNAISEIESLDGFSSDNKKNFKNGNKNQRLISGMVLMFALFLSLFSGLSFVCHNVVLDFYNSITQRFDSDFFFVNYFLD